MMRLTPLVVFLAAAFAACAGDESAPVADGGAAPADRATRGAAPGPGSARQDRTDAAAASPAVGSAPSSAAAPGGEARPGAWSMPPIQGEGAGEIRGVAVLRAVRTARHDGHDRIVFEFEDHLPPWKIRAVREPVQCGSGHAVDPGGATALEVDFRPASAHTEEGVPTVRERERRPRHPALRAARLTCDFEAIVTWVLGVDHGGQIRALELTSPARLAVDIRHR